MENRLKLVADKTKVLLCRPSLQKAALIEHILVGELQINLSDSVRDLGLVIDANLDMTTHIRSLGKLWPFLTHNAPKVIAVSLIMSRRDYCNSTLWMPSS